MANNSKKKDFSREIDSSKIQDFSNKFVHFLEKEYGLGKDEISNIMSKAEKKSAKEIRIPVSIFDNKELSILETICKYLKEELMLNFHKIALSLNRNDRTIWATYNNSLKKRKKKLVVGKSEISIPLSLLKNRKFTAYELIVLHLKDSCKLNYHQMGILLRRDERNIWTTYQKARKKNVK